MAFDGPGVSRMVSRSTPAAVRGQFLRNVEYYGGDQGDVELVGLCAAAGVDKMMGYRSVYMIKWRTYVGWKVWMLCSGAHASDPRHEVDASVSAE